MKKDDIKTLIVVIIICLVCGIIAFIVSIRSNVEKLKSLSEYGTYFSVINSINEYFEYLNGNDSVGVYSLIDDDYIIKNEINETNVFDYVSHFPLDHSFKVVKLTGAELSKNFYLYYAEGKVIQNTYDGVNIIDDDYKILIIYDYDNMTKAIYPIKTGDDTNAIINGVRKKTIIKNEYNSIKGVGLIKSEQICAMYLSNFVNYIVNDTDKAYDLLSDDMKKYYTSVFAFQTAIDMNKFGFTADKCRVSNGLKGRIYSVIDNKGNKYTFKEKGVMDYSVDIVFYNENKTAEDSNSNTNTEDINDIIVEDENEYVESD